ncbi:MAG: DegT/DnrJ/EryC1/StrS aminotransferase family protein [Desulfobacula sp.]|nr:DegT/DnrJ/EryC1/StrS aminotransferase family protein [Desulfobacula sp.]
MIRLASPDIRPEDIARAVDVIESGNLIQGSNVKAFEDSLCEFSGLSDCAVVSSGTAALHLALIALGIKSGDVVIVPAFTFPATANVVEAIGADILLCDVSDKSYVMGPKRLEDLIAANKDRNITAVIAVHEFGYPAEIAEISRICCKYGLKLIEDAACALGTTADSHHPGYYSDVACFSFHPRKAITTGEGGALLSHNKNLISQIKILRNHGIDLSNEMIDFIAAGFNYRMSDFQAALAIGQLERFGQELVRREYLAGFYATLLEDCTRISLPKNVPGHSWQSFMTVVDEDVDRNMLIPAMADTGIQVNLGAQALNCLKYYRTKYGLSDTSCPAAARLYHSGLVLPLYGKMQDTDVEKVCSVLQKLLSK